MGVLCPMGVGVAQWCHSSGSPVVMSREGRHLRILPPWRICKVSQHVPPNHPLALRALAGLCTAGPGPMSVSSLRGGGDPAPGIPGFSTIALVKLAERVQGRQEKVHSLGRRSENSGGLGKEKGLFFLLLQ